MLFTYVFGEKLDLSRFRKQAINYISTMRDLSYHLYLPNYKISLEISTPDNQNGHLMAATLFHIKRDEDKEITQTTTIFPVIDSRFQEIKAIQDLWNPLGYGASYSNPSRASFTSNNVVELVEKICIILKIVHKIDSLKAFL